MQAKVTVTVTLSGPVGSFPTPSQPTTNKFSGSSLKEVLQKIVENGEHYAQRILSATLSWFEPGREFSRIEQGGSFRELLKKLEVRTATTLDEAVNIAAEIGYPVRVDFPMVLGSPIPGGDFHTEKDLRIEVARGLTLARNQEPQIELSRAL